MRKALDESGAQIMLAEKKVGCAETLLTEIDTARENMTMTPDDLEREMERIRSRIERLERTAVDHEEHLVRGRGGSDSVLTRLTKIELRLDALIWFARIGFGALIVAAAKFAWDLVQGFGGAAQ